jgi:hypothetical protein
MNIPYLLITATEAGLCFIMSFEVATIIDVLSTITCCHRLCTHTPGRYDASALKLLMSLFQYNAWHKSEIIIKHFGVGLSDANIVVEVTPDKAVIIINKG